MQMEIKVPKMGESISEAVVGTLLKASGTTVKLDEEIVELETDKVNQVLYAPQAGHLVWQVQPGQKVGIEQVLGYVESEVAAGALSPAPAAPAAAPDQAAAIAPSKEAPLQSQASPAAATSVRYGEEAFLADLKSGAAPPPVASAPKQPPVPVKSAEVPATERPSVATSAPPSHAEEPAETRRPMSRIRQVIAQRLVEAQQQSAMLTTFNEVDMTVITALRAKYKEDFSQQHGTRLGLLPFFIKAVVAALQAFPVFNSYIDGTDVVQRHYYDICVAIGADRGLVAPVVRQCDQLPFALLEKQLADYTARARTGRLTIAELQGGCFTITNGGVYGSLLATPLLNPPQCGILGIHKIEKRPVVSNDQIVIKPMMYIALSYDHRLIDGKEAVLFLVHIKEHLEDPTRLLLNL